MNQSKLRRYRSALVVVACTLITAVTATGSIGAPHRPPCKPKHSVTLFQDQNVRVYSKAFDHAPYAPRGGHHFIACKFSVGKGIKIAQENTAEPGGYGEEYTVLLEHVTSAGRWLGFSLALRNKYDEYADACAVSLRTGERHCSSGDEVSALGVTRAGSLAWLGNPFDSPLEIRTLVGDTVARLDSGDDIASFAVSGRRIYWTKAGVVKSATMP